MASKREKMLLDFMFEVSKEINEFIERNGYTAEELTYASLMVWPTHNDKGPYMRSEINVLWPSGNSKRYVEKLSVDGDSPSYKQINWEDKK